MISSQRSIATGLFICVFFAGCAAPVEEAPTAAVTKQLVARSASYDVTAYQLTVGMDPKSHRLESTANMTISLRRGASSSSKLLLQLHRDLGIDVVTVGDRQVPFRRIERAPPTSGPTATSAPGEEGRPQDGEEETPEEAVYEIELPAGLQSRFRLGVVYGGVLQEDVAAGEKPGEIHNYDVDAHIGSEGVFLSASASWYPRIAEDPAAKPTDEGLATFELTATNPPATVLVASGNRVGAKVGQDRGEKTQWRTPFAIDGMTLVGGPHHVRQRQVGKVLVSVHLLEKHLKFADSLLDAIESYLNLYQPLIGSYPFVELTVVENFFSSGFGFPGYTTLASEVIGMGEGGLRPGYVNHELLHNWWGNGVFVSALDGNWCECLTSYCTNYMRLVLEGREEKARAKRRDICYGLSRLTKGRDLPLCEFGINDEVSRFIGYQKGSMVFAMLAQKIGDDQLWRSLKRLYRERLGKPTTWHDIQRVIERESGRPLGQFFRMWVQGSGVPQLEIESATYDSKASQLTLSALQKGERPFEVTLPVRLVFEQGHRDEIIKIKDSAQVFIIRTMKAPKYVDVDPDFRLMRKIPLSHVMPTISGIGKSKSLTIVREDADFEGYETVAAALKRRYEEAEETAATDIPAEDFLVDDAADGHVLLLGKACLAPAAEKLLEGQVISFGDGFFTFEGQRFDDPGQAVLCALRNEQDPGGVICIYYGNSPAAIARAGLLTFYGGNSLIVFENGKPTLRRDFERPQRVEVEIES